MLITSTNIVKSFKRDIKLSWFQLSTIRSQTFKMLIILKTCQLSCQGCADTVCRYSQTKHCNTKLSRSVISIRKKKKWSKYEIFQCLTFHTAAERCEKNTLKIGSLYIGSLYIGNENMHMHLYTANIKRKYTLYTWTLTYASSLSETKLSVPASPYGKAIYENAPFIHLPYMNEPISYLAIYIAFP